MVVFDVGHELVDTFRQLLKMAYTLQSEITLRVNDYGWKCA